MPDNKPNRSLLYQLTEILKGISRDVPARVAVEHAVSTLANIDAVAWASFVILAPEPRCVFVCGDLAPRNQLHEEWTSALQFQSKRRLKKPTVLELDQRSLHAVPILGREVERVGWILLALDRELDELEEILGMVAWLLNIALEHDHLQGQLNSLDQRYLSVIESLPHVIYEQELAGRMVFVSGKIFQLAGYTTEEITEGAVTYESLILEEDRERRRSFIEELLPQNSVISFDFLSRKLRVEEKRHLEYRLMHRNGRDIVWVEDHFMLRMRNPTETVSQSLSPEDFLVVGAVIDIRARKRFEIESLQKSKLVTIGELAASVAHEINNPLTAVLNYGQLLERWFKRQNFDAPQALKGTEYLRHIIEQGKVIDNITRDLTGFVRKSTCEQFQPVDVYDLVTSSLAIFRYPFRKEQIRLEVEISKELPPICARADQLRQVLINLVSNARISLNDKFAESQSLNDDKFIGLKAELSPERSKCLRLSISDCGEGISEVVAEKVFDAFFTTRKDGTGLGLAIVKQIIDQHQGSIKVESVISKGTTFHIDLPIWDHYRHSSIFKGGRP